MAGEAPDAAAGSVARQRVVSSPPVTEHREPREKRSVTLDAPVAHAVDRLVEDGRVASFSAAINAAAARWVANQQLRATLDEIYEQDPKARPDPEAVEAAARKLGLV